MEFNIANEGLAKIKVPVSDIPEYGRKYGFYKPEMETDRNISVSVVSVFSRMFRDRTKREPSLCDLLCATGIRGIRYFLESGIPKIMLNDINENAFSLARENAISNNIDFEITNSDANELLSKNKFDIIDIDPFGSPCYFMDSAARSCSDFSLVCMTATDTAALFRNCPPLLRRCITAPPLFHGGTIRQWVRATRRHAQGGFPPR